MPGRLAIKRLTASDLTLFAHQLRTSPAGKQKALNMNKDVFVERLFPALRDTSSTARYPVDLFIYGPGLYGELNIARKILIQEKNWRLNGEKIENPDNEPGRFNVLQPGDLAVFEFNDGPTPNRLRVIFVSSSKAEDSTLHQELNALLGEAKMAEVTTNHIELTIQKSNVSPNHPIRNLNLDVVLETLVLDNEQAAETILASPTRPRISVEALQRARESASRTGAFGEQLVNDYFSQQQEEQRINSFEWVSRDDALSPYDFWYSPDGQSKILVDVKSTSSTFEKPIHISSPELRRMTSGPERYDIYRVYEIAETKGKLRIASNVGSKAKEILDVLSALPEGITADGVSLNPLLLPLESEEYMTLILREAEDE